MTLYEIILILIFIFGFGLVVYFIRKKPQQDQGLSVMMEWLKEMRSSSETMHKRMDETKDTLQSVLNNTNKAINERLDNAARVIGDVKKDLGSMTQIGPEIKRLSEVLASPKTRGTFGEEMLENMLAQVLPRDLYQTQYKFRSGDTVDIIVKIGDRLLCIDSKFSMENYRLLKEAQTDEAVEGLRKMLLKDIKKRVDEIHKKYILPQENTFDFAIMYVPSEGVYQEMLSDVPTLTYCRDKHVLAVSPNGFYHYLQTILISLRGQKIHREAERVLAMIAGIKQESEKFGRNLEVLGSHIKNANNTMGLVSNDFVKLKTNITNAAVLQIEEAQVTKEQALQTEKLLE